MKGQGVNAVSNNGNIWIGGDGPNKFNFINRSGASVILIIWDRLNDVDDASSFMKERIPQVSYSLPKSGDTVTISMANGKSGGLSSLNNRVTKLTGDGQIYNTWVEFHTGNYATVDVTRLINMSGNRVSVKVTEQSGCMTDMDTCVFVCKEGNTCGVANSFDLRNCEAGSQPGASWGLDDKGQPSGGCQGWTNGGVLDVSFEQ
jgi:hypothetical protein